MLTKEEYATKCAATVGCAKFLENYVELVDLKEIYTPKEKTLDTREVSLVTTYHAVVFADNGLCTKFVVSCDTNFNFP